MPDADKVFVKRFNELEIGQIVFIVLLFSIAGTTFMAFNQLKAGTIYAILMSSSFIALLLLTLLRKDEDRPSDFIPIPFCKRFSVSVFMYFLGLVIPIVLGIVLGAFAVSSTAFSVPLFSGDITEAGQSFNVANLEEQMSTRIFNIVYVAGSDETIVYNWLAVLFGAVAGMIVLRLLSKERSPVRNKFVVKLIAYAFAVGVFMLSHLLNASYDAPLKFIIAGVFLLVSSLSMFAWGLPISFWIGFHQSNNLMYLIGLFGLATVAGGFVGLFGGVTLVLIILICFYLINNWDVVKRDLRWWWGS